MTPTTADNAAAWAAIARATTDRVELLMAAALVCHDDELDAIAEHVRAVPFDPAEVDQLPGFIAQLLSQR